MPCDVRDAVRFVTDTLDLSWASAQAVFETGPALSSPLPLMTASSVTWASSLTPTPLRGDRESRSQEPHLLPPHFRV